MKLSGPDFFEWMGLRRVRRGGVARREGTYYEHGNPVPGWLIPDIHDGLLQDGLLELGEPEFGMQQVTLTEAGLARYRALCQRQRRKDLAARPPCGTAPAISVNDTRTRRRKMASSSESQLDLAVGVLDGDDPGAVLGELA
jgi:hypothetical protein